MKDFFAGFQEGIKKFGGSISMVVNTVILFLIYIFGVGLTSIFAIIFSKKFLDLEADSQTDSYWHNLNLGREPLDHYYRQF